MRLFVDTNVLLDCYQYREPFFKDWQQLALAQYFGDVELWVSAKSFTDVFYICRKQLDAQTITSRILKSLSRFHLCSIDGTDVRQALEKNWNDFEDALIAQAAEKTQADYIVTRDQKGFSNSQIASATPAEIVQLLKDEQGLIYTTFSEDDDGTIRYSNL